MPDSYHNTPSNISYLEFLNIKLTVSDGEYISNPDFVTVSIDYNNTAPAFDGLPDTNYSLKVDESFILDLSSLYDYTSNGLTENGYN
ncbi:MAG: hypothetical protein P8M49_06685, partial [Thalassotalea sp.]|nr:hypothetical protein [Thalassotalea sp.]